MVPRTIEPSDNAGRYFDPIQIENPEGRYLDKYLIYSILD